MSKESLAAAKDTYRKNKRTIKGLVITVALVAVLSASAHALFRIQGVVTGVDNNNVTVANFFWSRTVDLSGTPFNAAGIRPGDRIMIQKNLQGNVLYVAGHASKAKPGFSCVPGAGYRDGIEQGQGWNDEGSRR